MKNFITLTQKDLPLVVGVINDSYGEFKYRQCNACSEIFTCISDSSLIDANEIILVAMHMLTSFPIYGLSCYTFVNSVAGKHNYSERFSDMFRGGIYQIWHKTLSSTNLIFRKIYCTCSKAASTKFDMELYRV